MVYDPRSLGTPVYEALSELSLTHQKDKKRRTQHKSYARELYTYISTWGLMRFKAEEITLQGKQDYIGKKDIIEAYFKCLEKISGASGLSGATGLNALKTINTQTKKGMDLEGYLGLTGIGLAIAQEFSFWANAVYHDISGEDN
jgi:hypothetical protein